MFLSPHRPILHSLLGLRVLAAMSSAKEHRTPVSPFLLRCWRCCFPNQLKKIAGLTQIVVHLWKSPRYMENCSGQTLEQIKRASFYHPVILTEVTASSGFVRYVELALFVGILLHIHLYTGSYIIVLSFPPSLLPFFSPFLPFIFDTGSM